jgi:hypothetical protein
LIYQDEVEIHRHPTLTRMWAPVGTQPEVPAPGQNEKTVACGGVDYATGRITYTIGVPLPQAVQASLSERRHVPLDGGPTNADDLSGLLTRHPLVQQSNDEHLFADSWVGMGGAFLVDDALLLGGQMYPKPSHGAPPCVPKQDFEERPCCGSHRSITIPGAWEHVLARRSHT